MREFAAHGKTVLFATHYLEEADAYADRVVLMATGGWWPTGRRPRSRHIVGSHDPRDAAGRRARRARTATGVSTPNSAATRSCSRCSDSDAAIRALLPRFPAARDIEIAGAGLEEAFLELTDTTTEERR